MATAIQFYHLLTTPLERALPKLLEKAYAGGFRTLLVVNSEEQADYFNQLLWTYDPNGFLPHGSMKDGNPEQQTILIVTQEILSDFPSPNKANLLLMTNNSSPEHPELFERILDVFNGNDPKATEMARLRWTSYKNNGFSVSYFRQEDSGWKLINNDK